jgi:glutamate-ammonia-ligase adenylyltransferase
VRERIVRFAVHAAVMLQAVRADAAKMRAEMARHKPPRVRSTSSLVPGGLVDLEFAFTHSTAPTTSGWTRGSRSRLRAAEAGLIDEQADPDLRLLSRMLVVLRLVAAEGMEPAEQSRALVATLCGFDGWTP